LFSSDFVTKQLEISDFDLTMPSTKKLRANPELF